MSETHLTGRPVRFDEDLLIVSKTDTRGRITYANEGFTRVSGYAVNELLGRPHSCVRHPDMPRSAFALMWSTLQRQEEFFAYVINRARNGDHYWVFAHVVPDIDPDTVQDAEGRHLGRGETLGYHSARRWAEPRACARAMEVYRMLLAEEARHPNPRTAVEAGTGLLERTLAGAGVTYEQWVFGLA